MQIRIVVATLALVAAALPDRGAPSEPGVARLAFAGGTAGSVILVNDALAPLAISQCGPTLERAEGNAWIVAGPHPAGCAEPRQLMPGDSGTLNFACPTAPGTYRLALPVTLERPSLDPLSAVTRSSSFVIPAPGPTTPCSYAR